MVSTWDSEVQKMGSSLASSSWERPSVCPEAVVAQVARAPIREIGASHTLSGTGQAGAHR